MDDLGRVMALARVLDEVRERVHVADEKHGRFTDGHHVYGVLAEEMAEVLDVLRASKASIGGPYRDAATESLCGELLDVATVAVRAVAQMRADADRKPNI